MAVPLSPDELMRKRIAIFKHEARRTRRCSPASTSASSGSAPKTATAPPRRLYDKLGLAEYEAIEGFVRWRP